MKRFLSFLGILAALAMIFFWPAPKEVSAIRLESGMIYKDAYDVHQHDNGVEFDVRIDGTLRHVHYLGSYWIEYRGK